MVFARRYPSPFFSSAWVLVLFLLASSLGGQSRPLVRCDALIGFNGIAREGRFAPLIVSVENPGPRLSVEVRVTVTAGSDLRGTLKQRIFTRELLLAGGATRRVPFLVPLAPDARLLAVSVTEEGTELARQQVDLRSALTADRIVAGISGELSLDALTGLSDGSGAVRVVYPRVDDLPESWAGYDGAEMVVVHDTSFQQLRPAQVTALERWVFTGGTLVFTGGAAALQHAGTGLEPLLPVAVTGLREQSDLPSLATYFGLRSGPRGRMVVAETRLTAGTVVASQDGMPVIVERTLGRGAVWFTAFDPTLPPFDSWAGVIPMWRLMTERERQPILDSAVSAPMDDPWMKAIIDSPPLAFPSALAVAAFAGCYLALLAPLLLGRLSRRIRRRPRLVFLLAIPAAAGLAAWLLFNRELFRPEPRLLEAATVRAFSNDGMALVTEKLGLFASKAGSSDLSLDASDAAIDEVSPVSAVVRAAGGGRSELAIAEGDHTVIRSLSYGRFGSRLLVLSQVIPFPVTVSARAEGSSVSVMISNAGDRPLRGCFLVRAGKGFPIGEVAPGATVSARFRPEDGVDLVNDAALERLVGGAPRVELWNRERPAAGSASAVVTGWLDGPVLPVVSTGVWRPADRPALSLVLLEAR